jgi:hypothetical protein
MPPDAFRVPAGGEVSSISLGPDAGEYRRRRGEAGDWLEFPVFLGGNFYQAQIIPETPEGGRKIIIRTAEPWELDILAYDGGRPSLIRVSHGEGIYFTVLQYRERRVSETWYDQGGGAAAVFFLEYTGSGGEEGPRRVRVLQEGGEETEVYDYDSQGNISALSSPRGEFSALYTPDRNPRYWERRTRPPPDEEIPEEESSDEAAAGDARDRSPDEVSEIRETYALQWDSRGFLVRITGTEGTEPVDLRYEYSLDERGNWIERREIRMVHRFGVLVPAPGAEFKRTIEYGE